MSMIVQTLSVLETEVEQSLEEAIAQKYETRKSEETTSISSSEEQN